ncbi:MAG: peroxiredoxin [Hyphomicrobium sp.]
MSKTKDTAWPWPAPVNDGAVKHILAGTRLPDVALEATRGAAVNLARFQERAVIFVYPFTGTPGQPNPPGWDTIPGAHGSTPEAEGFRDHYADFELRGYEVFGLSGQTSADQRAFAARMGIPFLLLSDAQFAFAGALQLPRFETGGKTYLKRLTLVVRNGVIYRVVYPVHPPHTHAAGLLGELTAPVAPASG